MTKKLIIAIDGPAGAGKSTAAKTLARRLTYNYLDTGALYRAMAWKMLEEKVDIDCASAVEQSCKGLEMRLSLKGEATEVFVDGHNVTPFLRKPEVTKASAIISAFPGVRKKLLSIQRSIGEKGGIVAEGRDIGTVVFPEAPIKFFLDANVSVRGGRRYQDLEKAGVKSDPKTTTQTLAARDLKDSQRLCSPLKRAADATLIDSTFLSAEEVVETMFLKIDEALAVQSESLAESLAELPE